MTFIPVFLAMGPGGQFDSLSLWMIVAIFAVFYFIVIRPQRREQKDHEQRLQRLKKGDKVITAGGIHGTVTGTNDKIISLRIAKNTEIDVNRASISTVVSPEKTTGGEGGKKGKGDKADKGKDAGDEAKE